MIKSQKDFFADRSLSARYDEDYPYYVREHFMLLSERLGAETLVYDISRCMVADDLALLLNKIIGEM